VVKIIDSVLDNIGRKTVVQLCTVLHFS